MTELKMSMRDDQKEAKCWVLCGQKGPCRAM